MHSRQLLGALVLAMLALGTAASSPGAIDAGSAPGLQGDVTCSGAVDAIDSLQVLRGVAGLSTNAKCLADAGDTDCDGDADSTDALRILRFVASLSVTTPDGCVPIGDPLGDELPPTSTALIAEALGRGDITYEDSILLRAYALFADPRLPKEYQSLVIDWEAGSELFREVDNNEGDLSNELLADLAPFRARPNDPASVHFDTPETAHVAGQGIGRAWRTALVPGTDARVWALGAVGAEQKYVNLVSTVWSHFLGVFAYPDPDQANVPNAVVNPDAAIDFYFVNPGIDPRHAACEVVNPDPRTCLVASDFGMSREAAQFVDNKSSGYLIVNAARIGADPLTDDNLVDTIAHELAHVSQFAYDKDETTWLSESTATWVAYRIMLDLGRTPMYAYKMAKSQYKYLDKPLTDEAGKNPDYRSWLFFQHSAMLAGDNIVSDVWEQARPVGENGINAVNAAFNLDENFDEFAVRNWNVKPPLLQPYKDAPDPTFPSSLKPKLDSDLMVPGEADYTLDLPVEPLAARYYRYVFGDAVRHIIVENNLVQTEHAHVWLLKKIGGTWKPPEDMAGAPVLTYCRDSTTFDENLEELVVIVSYSKIDGPALDHHSPRVIADEFACAEVEGWASTALRVVSGDDSVTYTSGVVNLRFTPRKIQDVPGNVQYDLSARSQGVHWVGSGTVGGCPAEGETTVLFPGIPYTGSEFNAGYLNVVGPGDFHSVTVEAYDPGATLTVTCPGDPPTVSHAGFDAAYLLLILMEPNSSDGTVYSGDCQQSFGSNITYHFTWNLHAADVLAPLRERAVEPAVPTPECFDLTPCPPVCPREPFGPRRTASELRLGNGIPLD